jgi:hypothetical protein
VSRDELASMAGFSLLPLDAATEPLCGAAADCQVRTTLVFGFVFQLLSALLLASLFAFIFRFIHLRLLLAPSLASLSLSLYSSSLCFLSLELAWFSL